VNDTEILAAVGHGWDRPRLVKTRCSIDRIVSVHPIFCAQPGQLDGKNSTGHCVQKWGANMKSAIRAGALATVLLTSACATASEDVRANFQPATMYEADSCETLGTKISAVKDEVYKVSGQQDQKRKIDQGATGVGAILFWPALLAIPLTKDHKRELADLKGKYEAMVRAGESKHCKF
jgi:hypothetical protein